MSKAIIKMPCADGNCKHNHEMTVDLNELGMKLNDTSPPNATVTRIPELTMPPTQPSQQQQPEVQVKEVAPDFMPGFTCKNGNCDVGIHKNPNYHTRPKGKCTNCGQFNKKKEGSCPWCRGKETIEEINDEELDDLGIPKPTEEEHNHEHS